MCAGTRIAGDPRTTGRVSILPLVEPGVFSTCRADDIGRALSAIRDCCCGTEGEASTVENPRENNERCIPCRSFPFDGLAVDDEPLASDCRSDGSPVMLACHLFTLSLTCSAFDGAASLRSAFRGTDPLAKYFDVLAGRWCSCNVLHSHLLSQSAHSSRVSGRMNLKSPTGASSPPI